MKHRPRAVHDDRFRNLAIPVVCSQYVIESRHHDPFSYNTSDSHIPLFSDLYLERGCTKACEVHLLHTFCHIAVALSVAKMRRSFNLWFHMDFNHFPICAFGQQRPSDEDLQRAGRPAPLPCVGSPLSWGPD